jgi:hypothetical protein
MNKLRPILLALTAVAALSVAYPAKANLITNPGFETGDFTGWTGVSNAAVTGTVLGVAPHSGSFQAELGAPASISQSVATTPGQSYTIDFFAAFASLGTGGNLSVNWGGSTVFSHLFPTSTGYTEFTINVPASASSTALNFTIGPAAGLTFLDDISVTSAGVPDGGTTVSLLGCALFGLAAVRRKLGC